jgi:hypothetical protein
MFASQLQSRLSVQQLPKQPVPITVGLSSSVFEVSMLDSIDVLQ